MPYIRYYILTAAFKSSAKFLIGSTMKRQDSAVIAFLLVSCCSTCSSLQEVCIVPEHGSSPNLPSSCNSTATINELCEQADTADSISGTVATFLPGTHTLDRNCSVHDVSNVTLRGQSGSKVLIQCRDAEFVFGDVHMLVISGIEFTSCGVNASRGKYFALSFLNRIRTHSDKCECVLIPKAVDYSG